MAQISLATLRIAPAEVMADPLPAMGGAAGLLALTVGFAVGALALLVWRLRRRLAERTRERDRSEDLFDHAAVAIIEEDFSEVSGWLDGLRGRGVEDLAAYLREHPDEVREQFGRVRVTAANRRALALFGADDLEDLGLRLRAAGAAATTESFPLELETLWAGRPTLECDTTLRIPGGPLVRLRLHWQVRLRRGVPNPSRVMLTFANASALSASDELYQSLFESLPVPAWVFDAETLRFVDVNRAAVAQYGWPRGEFLNLRVVDVLPPEEVPALAEALAAVEGEFRLHQVWRHRARDGRAIEAEMTSHAIQAGGRRAILSILRDVTESRRVEGALRESEERFRTLFEHAVEGIYESLPGGGFCAVNPALARLLGYTDPGELLALAPPAIAELYLDPARRGEFLQQLAAWGVLGAFESEVRRRDGTVVWISENVRAERDGAGRIARIHGFVSDITGRKRAELALRDGEARYRALFEDSPVAILELDYAGIREWFAELRAAGVADLAARLRDDAGGRRRGLERVTVRQVNEAALRLLHAQGRAQLSGPLAGLMAPDGAEPVLSTLLALWRGEFWAEGEAALRCVDGGIRQFTWRWGTAAAPDGGIAGCAQIVLRDVTAQRRTEAELRASEQRFRLLFELSPVGIAEFDYGPTLAWFEQLRATGLAELGPWLDAHPAELSSAIFRVPLVGANAATLRLLGASSLAELAEQGDLLLTPEAFAARRSCLLAAWSGSNESEGEIGLRALDGTERRVYYRWRIPRIEGRLYADRAQFVMLDLTEVKSAERSLAAERERLSVTLRAMTEGVITTDPDGRIRFMNDAAAAMTGWNEGAAVGRPSAEVLGLSHDRTNAALASPVATALGGDRLVDVPPHTRLAGANGSSCLIEGRCALMHDAAGRVLGTVLVFRDVTERSRLEAELLRASKLESVGFLAGGIAHDFNNLLAVIMGNLSLALMDEGVAQRAGAWLQEAEQGAHRAKHLTHQLLTFAKGGAPIRTTVCLQDVVREAAEFATRGSTVRCEFDLAADLKPVDADKEQIGAVVHNLVINALQAMPDGGAVLIALRNERVPPGRLPLPPGPYLRLSITDAGAGIPPEYLSHIFEPYFTTKKEGAGLGLATVDSIVRKHQGHVTAESEVGRGTSFHVWLPAAPTPAPAPDSPGPLPSAPGGLAGRILFMDDEEALRLMAAALLGRLGLEVVAVPDGEQAVEAFAAARAAGRPFDLVMMDLTVPGGMGGLEAMRAMLAIDPAVRGIVSSGYSGDPVMASYRAHGFSAMMPKPYRGEELARVLQDLLGRTGAPPRRE
jgi:PAS domain S-box-containing protein